MTERPGDRRHARRRGVDWLQTTVTPHVTSFVYGGSDEACAQLCVVMRPSNYAVFEISGKNL